MSRRRRAVGLSTAVVAAVGIVALMSGGVAIASAPGGAGSTTSAGEQEEAVAKLVILEPGASIRREGKTEFKPAKDGANLRVGDTVETDDTGFVEIQYTDDSFTRLDVNTTFTILSLTDDQGNRKINGSLESGAAWNRTSTLTESESFEQEGAGATAAVVGTVFAFECDGLGHCTLTSAVHDVQYSNEDGEFVLLKPLEQCEATLIEPTNTDLCDVPSQVTKDAFLANDWLMKNYNLDALLGLELPEFPDGDITITGTIEVKGIQVFAVINPIAPPDDVDPPVCEGQIFILGTYDPDTLTYTAVNECADSISTVDDDWVQFLLLGTDGGDIVFTDLPSASAGFLETGLLPPVDSNCGGGSEGDGSTCVKDTETYSADTAFWYVPKNDDSTSFDYEAADGNPDPPLVPVNQGSVTTLASTTGAGETSPGSGARGKSLGHSR